MSILEQFQMSSYLLPLVISGCLLGVLYLIWKSGFGSSSNFHGSPLVQYSRDLTALAKSKKLDPVIGREKEIAMVIQTLCRRTKNNPVLVGAAGVGKTAIAEGLAQRIASGDVPQILLTKKVLSLDLTGILAGTKYRGEFEKRLKEISDEIIAANRSIILFIDEIHTLADAGGAEGSIDADDILKPALARGDLQVIGATTPGEYEEYIKKDVTLDRRLRPVLVSEPSKSETISVLQGIKEKYEQFHNVKISDEAIKQAVELSGKHVKNRQFPDKAIDLMDEAASKVGILTNYKNKAKATVTAADVKAVMGEWQKNKLT